MTYKIRRVLNKGPRNPFYFNVAHFHLPRPHKKEEFNFPIVQVSSGEYEKND